MTDWHKQLLARFTHRDRRRPVFLVVAGGSASGKGTLARALASALEPLTTQVVNMDRYFKPSEELPTYHSPRLDRPHGDWNRPDSFHHRGLIADMRRLVLDGTGSEDVLILEGILALHFEELRDLAHLCLFVHTEADERIVRRLRRNMTERGMSFDEVADYYLESVRDRHLQYVEPTRRLADLVVPGGSRPRETQEREAMVAELAGRIKTALA